MLTPAEKTRRSVALTLAEAAKPPAPRPPVELVRDNCQAEPPPAPSPQTGAELPAPLRTGMPVDRWIASETGLRRWRPIFDAIEVVELPIEARELVVLGRPFRLEAELAAHLAWLLMPEEWRVCLGSRGVAP